MTERGSLGPNGPAAAALLAAGIGSFVLGLLTTLAAAAKAFGMALNLYNPVGPLSGKTAGAVAAWLIAWVVLHLAWKDRQVNFGATYSVTLILLILGLLGTFPPVFEAFE